MVSSRYCRRFSAGRAGGKPGCAGAGSVPIFAEIPQFAEIQQTWEAVIIFQQACQRPKTFAEKCRRFAPKEAHIWT